MTSEEGQENGRRLFRVDVYEYLSGRYFPKLENENAFYLERNNGTVELVEFKEGGSRGSIVEDQRSKVNSGSQGK